MIKNLRKITLCLIALFALSITSVGAAHVYTICQQKRSTGHGYYHGNCSGTSIKALGYYDNTDEAWMVMNYTGIQGDEYRNSFGVYAGKRNGSSSEDVKKPFASYAHVHHFTTNRR